jgi:beta-barrel assembly-enhancing protease
MNKVILRGVLGVLLFFLLWFLLTQINWVSHFQVKRVTDKTEEKLGELIWEIFDQSEEQSKNEFIINSVDSLVDVICATNQIERESIKVHIVEKNDINAIALPDGHLIIYKGLISYAANQEELCGVICHEIGHIELDHVMNKLVREFGLAMLISTTSGNAGSEITRKAARVLSSTAFDRGLEKEADIKAVDLLSQAGINPRPYADLLYRLSSDEPEVIKYMTWISTHPDSRQRAEYIINYASKKPANYRQILSDETWKQIKEESDYND